MPEDLASKNLHREELRQALEEEISNPEELILPTDIIRVLPPSSSNPLLIRAFDPCSSRYGEYIVKGKQAGRQIINDRVAAKLGQSMQAPVGQPYLMEISQELLDVDPDFSYLATGIAHATKFIPNCSDDHGGFLYANSSANRSRFAYLAVLYGWMHANDRQFMHEKKPPLLVYSVDHGHFFVGGPDWTREHLTGHVEFAQPDPMIVKSCNLNDEDLKPALTALKGISQQTIVQVVGSVPTEWGISIDERITLVEYLVKRQNELLEFF